MSPVRIQRKREKGWRMPEGAVYVGRPSLWGNPWTIAEMGSVYDVPIPERPAAAVRAYRRELEHWGLLSDYGWYVSDARWAATERTVMATGARNMGEAAVLLKGKNLACWCPLDQPCHADVLLELANS